MDYLQEIDQPQPGMHALGFRVQTLDGFTAVDDAVADFAQRFARGVQRVVLPQQRVVRLAQRLLNGFQFAFARFAARGGFLQRGLSLAHSVADLQKRLLRRCFLHMQAIDPVRMMNSAMPETIGITVLPMPCSAER